MIYEFYGILHKNAKKFLNKNKKSKYRMVSIPSTKFDYYKSNILSEKKEDDYINNIDDISDALTIKDVYPIENIIRRNSFKFLDNTYDKKMNTAKLHLGATDENCQDLWLKFISNSQIPLQYKNGGLHYAGYILEENEWCLPSWIWTNAAIVRMYCSINMIDEAKRIADTLVKLQDQSGGWIVRNDYNEKGAIPVLAPNDSSYIANNCCLSLYLHSKEEKYLNAAKKCADWIISTSRPDGLVYLGYDCKNKKWLKKCNIVDIGFTGGFFANLYTITKEEKYLIFLRKFIGKYIEVFYSEKNQGFFTSIDEKDNGQGGMFGRGQAWALEGLIPAYAILKSDSIKSIIEDTINTVIKYQTKDGGWPYNFTKLLMGKDCKTVSVIAWSLMQWYKLNPQDEKLKVVCEKAYKWCVVHTETEGEYSGGIFSYSVEGAIVHHMYTNTAFVYASAYAIELKRMLKK